MLVKIVKNAPEFLISIFGARFIGRYAMEWDENGGNQAKL
jgi:hypothetical protein